jgi:ferrochelatase
VTSPDQSVLLCPVKWLGPSLEETLHKISQKNKKVVIYPISFTVDNVETVYELGIEYEEVAKKFGFESYKVVSCPNDDEDFARALSEIIDEKMES